MSGDSIVRAILGPTNKGKTYLANERMSGHSSGDIGFPLRLLAREVYERVQLIARNGGRQIDDHDARFGVHFDRGSCRQRARSDAVNFWTMSRAALDPARAEALRIAVDDCGWRSAQREPPRKVGRERGLAATPLGVHDDDLVLTVCARDAYHDSPGPTL